MSNYRVEDRNWLAKVFESVDEETSKWPAWMSGRTPKQSLKETYTFWTDREIGEYQKIRIQNQGLGLAYVLSEIPPTEPGKRANYLAEKLKLTMAGREAIMKIASDSGKPAALRKLEEMFVVSLS